MDRNRHAVTRYLSDEKKHAAINSRFFKKLDHVIKALYEVELAKAHTEKKLIIVGVIVFQFAKQRMLELYYNISTEVCDVDKYEVLEMDIDSLYLTLAEIEIANCIRQEMKTKWERLRSKNCIDFFSADTVGNFFQ